jgi:hypothetical protein
MQITTEMIFGIIFIIAIIFGVLSCNTNENFHFKSPPLSYDAESCGRMCDNTNGCNSYYYDPVTRQCWMNSYKKYGDLYYPYVNNTYGWLPSRYRWGRYWGYRHGNHRPLTSRKMRDKK